MFRQAYRNFGDHESLVINHTVDANGADRAGIHWLEIRSPNSSPFIHQEGIYSPDSDHRWMGSIAMDRDGNMALGYSVSSSSVYPSVRYAGRLVTDPLGTMGQGEATLIAGAGSQTGGSRWGDYSDMTVDPVDDCTFWYTQEYYATTSAGGWLTRIGSFKFPSCGAPAPSSTPTSTPIPTYTFTPTLTATPGVIIVGHVMWQGRPAQPDVLQQLPITLTLKSGTTEVNYPVQNTDASGFFTQVITLPNGSYDWRVKGPLYLANSGNVTLSGAPTTNVEIGLMRVGDCNNDNVINIVDFNILKVTFGKALGDPGYDGRADFNGDNVVSVQDFNLQKGNFGHGGAPPLRPDLPWYTH
jgi:hypothetical protein